MSEDHKMLPGKGKKPEEEAAGSHGHAAFRALVDFGTCTVCVYPWAQDPATLIDVLVSGFALEKQGSRARRVCCLDVDTMDSYLMWLLAQFWDIFPVKRLELPVRFTRRGTAKLQGGLSKLQAWDLFASGDFEAENVVMMDPNVLPINNFD